MKNFIKAALLVVLANTIYIPPYHSLIFFGEYPFPEE